MTEAISSPKFSIITPSFNYGQYIGECLASVAGQEGVSYEHLVMDGGSTDHTAEVVAEYPKAQFFQEPDRGMSEAINKGFRKAQGTWVMWLNADDLLLPGALSAVQKFVNENQKARRADLVYGTYQFIDGKGAVLRQMKLLSYSRFISMHYGCYVPSTATFLRRETTIGEGHLLDERMKLVMDNEYYARLSLAGKKLCYFPRSLAKFRIHEGNLSQIGSQKERGLDAELSYALKAAESEAVRRTYGITLTQNRFLNHGADFVFYCVGRVLKGLGKLPYLLRNPDPR